ncbi:MAG: transglycosylase domain-containing protein, partial [Deltaproteobacteria bacterium]|nr:transglycosylase domain-containing protein [Deltaproteobacteria bacterium]
MKGKIKITGKRIFLLGLAGLVLVLGLLIYGWTLSGRIDQRFSGRLWSIPSRVYSDITLLYPGQNLSQDHLLRRLSRLGYRPSQETPRYKGQFRTQPPALEIFLRDLNLPFSKRQGFPVRLTFGQSGLESIVRLESGQPLPLIELEPEEITQFFGQERESRQLVSLKRLPRHLIQAVLAAEDANFFDHSGVDPSGILRALYKNLKHGGLYQGGSTITQQLAKNYFLTPERTLSRKLKELAIALTLEAKYDKETILEIYLNEIYFGQKGSVSINGLGQASDFYFSKKVEDLSLAESALWAGLIKAPNLCSPHHNPQRCLARRNQVLKAMHRQGWISREELSAASAAPLATAQEPALGRKAPYFVDYLSQQLTSLYSPEDLASLGLSIYTSLDSQVQEAAERALARGLARLEKTRPALARSQPGQRLQGAVIV